MIRYRGSRSVGAEPVAVVMIGRATVGKRDQLRTAALTVVTPSRAEPGCIDCNVYSAMDDDRAFILHEKWASADAFDRHKKSSHFQDFLIALRDLLDGKLDMALLTPMRDPVERQGYKIARTKVPRTAEFKPYREAKQEKVKSCLIDMARAALRATIVAHADRLDTGIRPDDVYGDALEAYRLRERWESTFGNEQRKRAVRPRRLDLFLQFGRDDLARNAFRRGRRR